MLKHLRHGFFSAPVSSESLLSLALRLNPQWLFILLWRLTPSHPPSRA